MCKRIVFALCAVLAVSAAGADSKSQPASPAPGKALRLLLPKEIPAVVGVETNIYFDNVVLTRRIRSLVFDVDCPRGRQQQERWTFTPAAKDVGTYPLTLKVCDETMRVVAQATTHVRVAPADAGKDRPVSLLIIGDSLTAASAYPERICLLFQKTGRLTMFGTAPVRSQYKAARHEGYGGWTCRAFVTYAKKNPDFAAGKSKKPLIIYDSAPRHRRRTSPFIFWENGKPTFDFPRYVKEHCGGRAPDFVTIALGCNDTFSADETTIESRIDSMFGYLDQLIAGVHAARKDTWIGIVSLVPPAGSQDAFGANYRCGQTRWQYRRNQHRVLERTFKRYGNRQQEYIDIIPAYLNLDTIHGYPASMTPPFPYAAVKVRRLRNGVHPAKAGYYQMGDSIYAWIKTRLAAKK